MSFRSLSRVLPNRFLCAGITPASAPSSALTLAVAITIAGGTCIALPAHADARTDDPQALDRVVVTATRAATTTDAALAPVDVIDRDEIVRSQAPSLVELLRGRAGVNIANQGGTGKLTSVFLRGAESDHVLVLIDGVRIGSATSGAAAFQDLPLEMIDRIEIVRGPRSSLYGSDAIGGVIQIFTRRDHGASQPRFALGAGSHGRREAGAGIGGGGERGWYGVDAAYLRTDGFNACRGVFDMVNGRFGGCFADQPDRDGYERRALSLRGGVAIGESLSLDGVALDIRGENEYDGGFVNRSKVVQQVFGAKLHWRAGERVAVQAGLGRNRDVSDNYLDGDDDATRKLDKATLSRKVGDFGSRRDSASVQADITLANAQLLTLGADWLRDRIDSSTEYEETSRRNVAAFAQYQGRFGENDVQLALRRDDNEQFGGETTGTAAWGLSFAEDWRVSASYGTGFKAPSFNELYFPASGNPALRPEASKTAEIGIAWRGQRNGLRLDAFSTEVDDLIAFDSVSFLPANIARARLRGAELRYDGVVFGWDLTASASWLDTENRSADPNRGNRLPRRAGESVRIDLDRAFGDLRFGLTAVGEGERYDDLANRRRLAGFGTLDLRAEYRFGKAWTLQGGVANVFDRRYETAEYYNQPGRTYSLRLRYAPTR